MNRLLDAVCGFCGNRRRILIDEGDGPICAFCVWQKATDKLTDEQKVDA